LEECICTVFNNALQIKEIVSNSISALEHSKTLSNCDGIMCYDELSLPYEQINKDVDLSLITPILISLLTTIVYVANKHTTNSKLKD